MAAPIPATPRNPREYASKAVEFHRSGKQDRARSMILRAARAAHADPQEWQSVIDVLGPADLDELLLTTPDQQITGFRLHL